MEPFMNMSNTAGQTMAERLLDMVVKSDPDEKHPKSKIAKICGISQSAVYQWFQGATKDPKGVHIGAVCRYYSADALWVLLGDQMHDDLDALKNGSIGVKGIPLHKAVEDLVDLGNVRSL